MLQFLKIDGYDYVGRSTVGIFLSGSSREPLENTAIVLATNRPASTILLVMKRLLRLGADEAGADELKRSRGSRLLAIEQLSRLSNVQPVIGPRSESKRGRCDPRDRGIRSLLRSRSSEQSIASSTAVLDPPFTFNPFREYPKRLFRYVLEICNN